MSIIDTLITDRSQADADALLALYAKPKAMWTTDEWNEFLLGNHRGAYNASDMNRVLDALDYLADRVTQFGYRKPEIKRPSITEVIPGTSRLPEGYTELEYIRSTGEQFVDTLVAHSSTSEFVLKADVSYDSVSESNQLMGFNGNSGNAIGIVKATWWELSSIASVVVGEKYSIEHSVNGTNWQRSVNGTTVTGTRSQYSFTTNLFLFAAMASATVSDMKYYCRCRLYSAQVLVDGETVRDYVPCLNPSNEVGLYDIVNGVFYGNAGTGYFLPGPVVSLPEGYRRLEYVRSTGTQYVDTGLTANNNTAIAVDVHLNGSENATVPYGVWDSGNPTNAFLFYAMRSSNAANIFYGTKRQSNVAGSYFTRGILIQNKNVFSFNGTVLGTLETQTFQSSNNMFLFAWNAAGTVADLSTMDIYSCAIHNDNVLARLYTPVLTDAGKVGLYDSITGEFYGNAGTGAFTAGEELESTGGTTTVRDCYAIGDRPSLSELAQYLDNVSVVRAVLELPDSVPEVPEDISQRITIEDANNIEIILTAVESLLNRISLSWFYSGEVYSGEV